MDYLLTARGRLFDIKKSAIHKRKTDKWKCCVTTVDFLTRRIDAAITALTGLGNSEDLYAGSEIIQRQIYDPIISYWGKELHK